METELLVSLNQHGFFPSPNESKELYLDRVKRVKARFEKISDSLIPISHWDWVNLHLKEVFDFQPECLPVFYSNRSLMPWQGAAIWIEESGETVVQLRKALQTGSFLKLYDREEILAHEAVHAARAGFMEDQWEEFFAFMTSPALWRRVLGPIIRRPWEVWPFLLCCLLGPIFSLGYLGAALWAFIGFSRLVAQHVILKHASKQLLRFIRDPRKIRAVLVRLSNEEIRALSRGEKIGDDSFRWTVIRKLYFK